MGSRAEVGSSARMTSGSTARARAKRQPLLLTDGEMGRRAHRAGPGPRPRGRPDGGNIRPEGSIFCFFPDRSDGWSFLGTQGIAGKMFLEFPDLVQELFPAHPVNSGSKRDVVVNGHGKGVGLLGEESHLLPQGKDIGLWIVDVCPVDSDLPFDMDLVVEVDQTIQGLEERCLSAARGADDGGDLSVRDVDRDVVEDLMIAVGDASGSTG